MQVHAETQDKSGSLEVVHRAPTAAEIYVQGYLAMCYGATGLIYYALHTTTDANNKLWGLFDEVGNHFIGNYNQVQNKINAVEPNDRFYAVKELNRQVDQVSSELLKLTWINGYNIHKAEPLGANNYISGITSYYIDGQYFVYDVNTYVELGEFKKTTDFSNPNLDYFLLVNRRCESSDFRHIVANFNITNSAYINWGIKDMGSGRPWTIIKTGSLDDTLSPGTGKLYRLAPVVLYGGDIENNETISGTNTLNGSMTIKSNAKLTVSGTYYIKGNITIESGGELLVSQGAHLNFDPGDSLFVNGKLTAAGPGYGSTLFTFQRNGSTGYWGPIIFDGSGSSESNLTQAALINCAGILCRNQANVTIQLCEITGNIYGIYMYNSSPRIIANIISEPLNNGIYGEASGLNPLIQGNLITKTSSNSNYHDYCGIYLTNHTVPLVCENDIRGFYYGAFFGDYNIAFFYTSTQSYIPNNRIMDNIYGLVSNTHSHVYAGFSNGTGAYNGFYGNSIVDAMCTDTSVLNASHNFWNTSNPRVWADEYSQIDVSNPLTDNPFGTEQIDNLAVQDTTGLLSGDALERAGRVDDAVNFYKKLIINNNHPGFALTKLIYILKKYNRNEIVTYLENTTIQYPMVQNLLAGIYLQKGQFNKGITTYNNIIANYSDDREGINARFGKVFAYLHIKKDPATASKILSNIKEMNSKDVEVQMRIKIAENLIYGNKKAMGKSANLVVKNIPTTYELYHNFPNPFNPITTIRYQIPKPGLVSLKVYDILGREVATLVNENKIEGFYDYAFNASRFPSGVYIYQLRVNDYVSSKKMILIK
jgi:tetratricopeptide (TPR) repeat protein